MANLRDWGGCLPPKPSKRMETPDHAAVQVEAMIVRPKMAGWTATRPPRLLHAGRLDKARAQPRKNKTDASACVPGQGPYEGGACQPRAAAFISRLSRQRDHQGREGKRAPVQAPCARQQKYTADAGRRSMQAAAHPLPFNGPPGAAPMTPANQPGRAADAPATTHPISPASA